MNNVDLILVPFFEDSAREFHIRLLARKTSLNPNTVINITEKLVNDGLLLRRKDKETNRVLLKANFKSREFKLKKKFYNLKRIYDSGLIDYVEDQLSFPLVVLFGSFAKVENHLESDLDLFILADEKKKLNLKTFESKLGCEIQVFLHTKEEFKRLKKTNKELVNNFINGEILTGFLEAF
jgi:predicted nucleotidyltransferase